MNNRYTIGIDLMGSDHPPKILISAVEALALSIGDNISFLLLATEEAKEDCLAASQKFPDKISYFIAKNSISMAENPLFAIRRKKDSTICAGMQMLRKGEINALVSSGNTGALMTAAKMFLPFLQGISRPALLALLPTKKTPVAVLDIGANLNCKSEHLIQFAAMGAAFQRIRGIKEPKVALLNIGSEAKKGTSLMRKTYSELKKRAKKFEFTGNIESKDVFNGAVDVVVTEGFTGNIFLKTAEGIASFILDGLKEPTGSLLTDLQKRLHYAEYPGAILCGVCGIVIKCHSYSTPKAFSNSVKGAAELLQKDFLSLIKNFL